MKEQIKKSCYVVVLVMMVTMVVCSTDSQAKVHRGTWKKNTQWSYDTKTKTITIKCQGRMADCPPEHNPAPKWRKYYTKAEKVVFHKGITYIGVDAFDCFWELKKVVLPEGLESIGNNAFENTEKLKRVQFPYTLTQIGAWAFSGSGLKTLSLRNVKKIGAYAFSGNPIKKLTIPSGCTEIKTAAFYFSEKLEHLTIENGIRKIPENMFITNSLKSLTIPTSVTEIGSKAFYSFAPNGGKLRRIDIKSTRIKKWGKDIFGKIGKDAVIYVPKSKKKEYTKALRKGGLPEHVRIVGK